MPNPPPRSAITRAIVNGRIRTGDPRRPWADAVALAGDRVVAIGSSAEIRKLVPPAAAIVDAGGATLSVHDGRVADAPAGPGSRPP